MFPLGTETVFLECEVRTVPVGCFSNWKTGSGKLEEDVRGSLILNGGSAWVMTGGGFLIKLGEFALLLDKASDF